MISSQFSSDEMCIIVSNQHPLVAKDKIALRNLKTAIGYCANPVQERREFFLSRRTASSIGMSLLSSNTTEAIINSVSAGLGFACLSRLAARRAIDSGHCKALNVPLDMKRRFWMLVHKDKYQKPIAEIFHELL
ncbi:LysR substrate-binding domain-containing protein [Vibrio chagasii]|nr:LysR substrate-binding domain-containing protein [Vibrio chagasii]